MSERNDADVLKVEIESRSGRVYKFYSDGFFWDGYGLRHIPQAIYSIVFGAAVVADDLARDEPYTSEVDDGAKHE